MARTGAQRQIEETHVSTEEFKFKKEWKAHETLMSEVFKKQLSTFEKTTKALLDASEGSRKVLRERGPEYFRSLDRKITQGLAPVPRPQDLPHRTFLTRRGPPFNGHFPQNPRSDPATGYSGFFASFASADDQTGKISLGVADSPDFGANPDPTKTFNYALIGPCDARAGEATIVGWQIPVNSSNFTRPLIAGFRVEFCVDPVAGSLIWPEILIEHGDENSAGHGFVGAQASVVLEVHNPDTQQIIASTDQTLIWGVANAYGAFSTPTYSTSTCSQGFRAFVVETSFLLPGGIRILTPWVTANVIAFRAATPNGNPDPKAGNAAITCGDTFLTPPGRLNLGGAMYLCDIVAYTFDPSTSV